MAMNGWQAKAPAPLWRQTIEKWSGADTSFFKAGERWR
jgi:hypothetical protein